METYLTTGTNYLSNCLFRDITNSQNVIKPRGGLWLTKHQKNDIYNPWVEYISDKPHLIIHKDQNFFNIPCALVYLNDASNIFILDSDTKLKYLLTKYPFNNFFNYNALSQDYEGIYIDFKNIKNNPLLTKLVSLFCVSSLIIFDLKAIKYYEPGFITPLGIYDDFCFEGYEFSFSSIKKEVLPTPLIYNTLLNQITEYINNFLITKDLKNISYDKYNKLYNEIYNCVYTHFYNSLNNIAQEEHISIRSLTYTMVDNSLVKFKNMFNA